MVKILVTISVIYFIFKFMSGPSLNQGKRKKKERIEEDEVEIRNPSKNPRTDRGDFIDYEEVD